MINSGWIQDEGVKLKFPRRSEEGRSPDVEAGHPPPLNQINRGRGAVTPAALKEGGLDEESAHVDFKKWPRFCNFMSNLKWSDVACGISYIFYVLSLFLLPVTRYC